jgi:hypothetical protein
MCGCAQTREPLIKKLSAMQATCSQRDEQRGSIVREESELVTMDALSNTRNDAPRRSNRQRLAIGLAAGLATMALAAPTAIARPAGPAAGAVFAHLSRDQSSVSTGPTNASEPSSSSADWGDTAIGVGGLLAIVALGSLGIHRRRGVPALARSATSTTAPRRNQTAGALQS